MTTFTETWGVAFEQSPADTDNASEGAGKIRGTRVAAQERLEVDHHLAGDAHDGKHKKVTLRPTSDPTLESGDAAVYTKTTTGLTDVFLKDPLGNVIWLSPRPGTCELTFQPSAQATWVKLNDGSIGSVASNATTRANADTERLFTLLWDNTTVTECDIQDSAGAPTAKGASAASDWAANRRIVIPITLGRALAVAGAGAGLTSRALAARTGTETHQLVIGEMPAHTHSVSGSSTGTTINAADHADVIGNGGTTGSTGGGGAHANMQPSVFLNVMMKL